MKCPWIENYLLIDTDGFSRACCGESASEAQIAPVEQGLKSAFAHPKLIQLRNELEQGFTKLTYNFCKRCEILESSNQESLRTRTPFLSSSREIKKIQFKLSNRCQLACAHCGPQYSSTWAKILKIKPHVQSALVITDQFLSELEDLLPSLSHIKFTGGEPFLDPNHWKILEFLQDKKKDHCTLEYITNGLTKPRPELWQGWKSVECAVSVDGYESSYEWFRRGASWGDLLDSVEELEKYATLSILYSVTPYTLQDYHKAKNFWKHTFYDIPIVVPAHASLFKFPKSMLEQIDNYRSIPYVNESATDFGDITFYRQWAKSWDARWQTPGWAEKLFFWMN